MRLSFLTMVMAVVAVSVGAEPGHVTVVTKEGRHGGTLSFEQVQVKTDAGVVKVAVADIAQMQFGDVDVVRTRQGKRVKGVVQVEGWVLKENAGEKTLERGSLRFIVPQATLGPVKKGQVVDGAAANGMTYHVRVPEKYDAAKGWPAIVFLHGSNANTADYLKGITQRWPKVAADYVLIGINGEWPTQKNPDGPEAYVYTYVNFVGKSKYKGFPGTDRESPALVAEVVGEIREKLKLSKLFVTGHSQGGFLAYSCLMNYPELFAGAMPMSAGLIFQCEPTAYVDAAIREQQRKRPIVIVHGEKDPLVSPAMARAAHESFLGDGWPMLKLLVAKESAHMFISLPFEEGVRWLESMTAEDARLLVASAEKAFAKKDYRDAVAYLQRVKELDAAGTHAGAAGALGQKIEQLASAPAKSLEAAMAKEGGGWVAEFEAFRKQFEFTQAAASVMAEYGKLRKAHEPLAEKVWGEARKAFGEGRRDEGNAKCEEIVSKYYASTYYRHAKQALSQRK